MRHLARTKSLIAIATPLRRETFEAHYTGASADT